MPKFGLIRQYLLVAQTDKILHWTGLSVLPLQCKSNKSVRPVNMVWFH